MAEETQKVRTRILRALSHGPAELHEAAKGASALIDLGERGTIAVDRRVLAEMIRAGQIKVADGKIRLDERRSGLAGRAGSDLGSVVVDTGNGLETVAIDLDESPLAQLFRRRDRNGEPFLSAAEFRAGERLRADYTRGQIMPRLSANWEASVSSGRRAGGIADLTEAALAARLRVERAIAAIGPELSGVLIDVCCFLKGMEVLEFERGWPARSAKIMLKAALGALDRHYCPRAPQHAGAKPQVLHWGAADYRPSLTGG